MPGSRSDSPARLRAALDRLYTEYNRVESAADPIHIVRRYPDLADREIVALCTAALAFGRVRSVLSSVEALVALMGPSPSRFIAAFDPVAGRRRLQGLGHRWVRDLDIVALLWLIHQMLDRRGSIERFFADGAGVDEGRVDDALESFCARVLRLDMRAAYGRVPRSPGVRYFFPRPSGGSAVAEFRFYDEKGKLLYQHRKQHR